MNINNHLTTAIAVQKVHPLNFPFLFVRSYFQSVYFWQSEALPLSFLFRFKQIDPQDHCSREEWASCQAEIREEWANFVLKSLTGPLSYSKDLFSIVLQHFSAEFERRCLFRFLCSRKQNLIIIESPVLNLGFELTKTIGRLGCHLLNLLFSRSRKERPFSLLVYGISPSEIPHENLQLDFSFLAARKLIPPEEALYITPRRLSPAEKSFLNSKNIRTISEEDVSGLLPSYKRLSISLKTVATVFFSIARSGEIAIYGSHPIIQSILWSDIFRKLKPSAILLSVSATWPEPALAAAAKAEGIKVLSWHYSANVFNFFSTPDICDQKILWTISVTEKTYVWNQGTAEYFCNRLIQKGQKFEVIGPVMCGDEGNLSCRDDLRARFRIDLPKEKILVGIFDVPSVSKATRLKLGFGPNMYPVPMLDRFFHDLYSLFEQDEKIHILIKPKRDFSSKDREFAASLSLFTNPKEEFRNRIHLLPHNIDPFVPIAMADICIGPPFTSPVLVANNAGIPGYFYDSSGLSQHFFDRSLEPLLVRTIDGLKRVIDAAVARPRSPKNSERLASALRHEMMPTSLGLGTVQFGQPYGVSNMVGQTSQMEVLRILRFAKEREIRVVDTAVAYGNCEEVLSKSDLTSFRVVTKIPPSGGKIDHLYLQRTNEAFQRSIERLGALDGLLVHQGSELLKAGGEKLFRLMETWKSDGLVQKIGVSLYSPDDCTKIVERFNVDLVQAPLNVFDQRFFRSGVIDRLAKLGIEFHSRSAFLQGALFLREYELTPHLQQFANEFSRWHNAVSANGLTTARAAFSFLKGVQGLNTVLVGVNDLRQLEELTKEWELAEFIEGIWDSFADERLDLIDPSRWK